MVLRKRKGSIEICVIIGSVLVVCFTTLQIITLATKNVSFQSTWIANTVSMSSQQPIKKKVYSELTETAKMERIASYQAKIKLRKKIKLEVIALERAFSKMLREKSMSPKESNEKMQNELYALRVKRIIEKSTKFGLVPHDVSRSRIRTPVAHSGSNINRNNTGNVNTIKDEVVNFQVLFPAQEFGIPLTFQPSSIAQEIAGTNLEQKKSTLLKHFQEFDKSDENLLKDVIQVAKSFGEDNFSKMYEDNFMKIKKQFQDGTELSVNEDLLKAQYSYSQDVCPVIPESLVGNTTDIEFNVTLDISEIVYNNSDVMDGGEWRPSNCISRHRIAVIIPYRDRWNHLKVLLYYLIPTLKRQQIHFRIFVVEQFGNETFNKGRIMNAAFREALKLFDFQCVTFHDVDLVPEDDRNMYSCTEQPKHMSHSIDKFKYILPYQGLVGGVLMFKREHFQMVNGYSNMYWGWGAEDDDMTTRILFHGLRIYRPPSNVAKYKMVKHDGRKTSEFAVRMRLLRSAAKRSKLEGLNNVKYTLLKTNLEKLFTHFIVDIGLP